MEDIKKLYSERRMDEIDKKCRQAEKAGNAGFEEYSFHACALASKNNLSRLTLEEAVGLFKKAAASAGDDEKKADLYENFTKEVLGQLSETESLFSEIAMTADIVRSYRDCMRFTADALEAAAELGDEIPGISTLEIQKQEVLCMVHLCAVYRYEVDMGKTILKQTDNVTGDIRKVYNEKYDKLTEQIRKAEPDYCPEEIQRTHVYPEPPVKKAENSQDAESESKSLFERLKELLNWGNKK